MKYFPYQIISRNRYIFSCADPKSFVRGGPTLIMFFYYYYYFIVDKGREDPNTTINGPSPPPSSGSAHDFVLRH